MSPRADGGEFRGWLFLALADIRLGHVDAAKLAAENRAREVEPAGRPVAGAVRAGWRAPFGWPRWPHESGRAPTPCGGAASGGACLGKQVARRGTLATGLAGTPRPKMGGSPDSFVQTGRGGNYSGG